MSIKLPFSNPVVKAMVTKAYPEAKNVRRPVCIEARTQYTLRDYWDGGSREYAMFLKLDDMSVVSSEALPRPKRQVMGNPFNLPIAEIELQPGFAIINHTIFCGKKMGYTIILHPDNMAKMLPDAESKPALNT